MPVHDAADCRAQNCHHHGPLVPRDVPHTDDQEDRSIPPWILDQFDYATCSICGEPVAVKGRATHVICALAAVDAGHGPPQTFIVGMAPQED